MGLCVKHRPTHCGHSLWPPPSLWPIGVATQGHSPKSLSNKLFESPVHGPLQGHHPAVLEAGRAPACRLLACLALRLGGWDAGGKHGVGYPLLLCVVLS